MRLTTIRARRTGVDKGKKTISEVNLEARELGTYAGRH